MLTYHIMYSWTKKNAYFWTFMHDLFKKYTFLIKYFYYKLRILIIKIILNDSSIYLFYFIFRIS